MIKRKITFFHAGSFDKVEDDVNHFIDDKKLIDTKFLLEGRIVHCLVVYECEEGEEYG